MIKLVSIFFLIINVDFLLYMLEIVRNATVGVEFTNLLVFV